MSEAVGQQLVVDNRGGAGGAIGMEIGKLAVADGYTLIWASTAAMTIRPHIVKKLPYDTLKDYEFITLIGITPNVLVVNPKTPAKTVSEFVEWIKANPGKINMGSAGIGSQSHFAGAKLAMLVGLNSVHVPYKGGGPLVTAVIAGESSWMVGPAPASMAQIKAGRLRVLGQSLPSNSHVVEGIPPIAEVIPGFTYSGWLGLLAPKGTPKPILAKLRAATIKVVNAPETKRRLEDQGVLVTTSTPDEFRKYVQKELVETGKVAKAIGIEPE
jgi:tripartite-type tricarboxylate transporter receptor subunit TctC